MNNDAPNQSIGKVPKAKRPGHDASKDAKRRDLTTQLAGVGTWARFNTEPAYPNFERDNRRIVEANPSRGDFKLTSNHSQHLVNGLDNVPFAIERFLQESSREAGQVEVWLGQRRNF